MSFIYIIENRINGKSYVGRTVDPPNRWHAHKSHAKLKDRPYPLYHAMNKHGTDAFTFSIISYHENQDETDWWEQYWIDELHLQDRRYGYNLDDGGFKAPTHTPDTIAKISSARKGQHNSPATQFQKGTTIMVGRKLSDTTRQLISNATRGKRRSKETEFKKGMIPLHKKLIDATTISCIIDDYHSGLSSLKLATKYSVSKPTILRVLHENNVELR